MTSPARAWPPQRQIYLIHPKFVPSYWGLEYFLPLTSFHAIYPPLALLTLGALTPDDFGITICDENAGEAVNYDTEAHLVGLTGYLHQKAQVFEHARCFRARGKTVLIGGPLANLLPEECRPHCDVLLEGEAEYTWPQFLHDYANGHWSNHYRQEEKIHLPDSPRPRLDLLKRRYAHGVVQCTRGCPFTCEFCEIIVMYGRKMRVKEPARILEEIQAWQAFGTDMVFFADDNFIGNRAYAKELLRAIAKWNGRQKHAMSFYTQASIDMVRDEELLGLLRDANFISVFIGIESPRKASLAESHKTQNLKVDLVQAVHKIQSFGLFVWAGMIVGFDNDDAAIFDEQLEFLQEAQIPMAMPNVLTAVPKTPLYQRLQAAGRLRTQNLQHPFVSTTGDTNFYPLRMSLEELRCGQEKLYRRLYSPAAFTDRLLGNLRRLRNGSYRPEKLRWAYLAIFFRLGRHYWRKGWAPTKFFCNILWQTLRYSPRSLQWILGTLGMYKHFCELHGESRPWDPWATGEETNTISNSPVPAIALRTGKP